MGTSGRSSRSDRPSEPRCTPLACPSSHARTCWLDQPPADIWWVHRVDPRAHSGVRPVLAGQGRPSDSTRWAQTVRNSLAPLSAAQPSLLSRVLWARCYSPSAPSSPSWALTSRTRLASCHSPDQPSRCRSYLPAVDRDLGPLDLRPSLLPRPPVATGLVVPPPLCFGQQPSGLQPQLTAFAALWSRLVLEPRT